MGWTLDRSPHSHPVHISNSKHFSTISLLAQFLRWRVTFLRIPFNLTSVHGLTWDPWDGRLGDRRIPGHIGLEKWVIERFFRSFIFTPTSFNMDLLLLFTWSSRSLTSGKNPFVLHYWDLNPPNIMVDKDNNLVR